MACIQRQVQQLLLKHMHAVVIGVLSFALLRALALRDCSGYKAHATQLEFSLVRACQRSHQPLLTAINTATLESCMHLAKKARALALNYSPAERRNWHRQQAAVNLTQAAGAHNYSRSSENRHSFHQQPQEYFNCLALACPENATFRSMVNDSRFDYYSLYSQPIEVSNYFCVPSVGLFQLQLRPANFRNATRICANLTAAPGRGALAHVASDVRTNALSRRLVTESKREWSAAGAQHQQRHLAFVGLHFNRSSPAQPLDFLNADNESLSCTEFVAWAPGHPRASGIFANRSCVTITTTRTWMTVDCDRELSFICEIYISKGDPIDSAAEADECAIQFH